MNSTIMRLTEDIISKRSAHTPPEMSRPLKSLRARMHTCVIFDTNGTPLAYGYNDFNVRSSTTEHAEAMAMRKLLATIKAKKPRAHLIVNLLVVRTNGGNSKPCENCIRRMCNYSQYFTIKKIYYSNSIAESDELFIEKTNLNTLVDDPDKHESSFYRNQRLGTIRNLRQCSSDETSEYNSDDSNSNDTSNESSKPNKNFRRKY
jgi:cytidine deaminase